LLQGLVLIAQIQRLLQLCRLASQRSVVAHQVLVAQASAVEMVAEHVLHQPQPLDLFNLKVTCKSPQSGASTRNLSP
jgi:hypothetical protein